MYSRRATVGTATELSHHLAVLLADRRRARLPGLRHAGCMRGHRVALPGLRRDARRSPAAPLPAVHLRGGLPHLPRRGHAAGAQPGQADHPSRASRCAPARCTRPASSPRATWASPTTAATTWCRRWPRATASTRDRTPWNEMSPAGAAGLPLRRPGAAAGELRRAASGRRTTVHHDRSPASTAGCAIGTSAAPTPTPSPAPSAAARGCGPSIWR